MPNNQTRFFVLAMILSAALLVACDTSPYQTPTHTADENASLREALTNALPSGDDSPSRLVGFTFNKPEKSDLTIRWLLANADSADLARHQARLDTLRILRVLREQQTRFVYVILAAESGDVEMLNLGFNQSRLDKVDWQTLQPEDVFDLADVQFIDPSIK